MLTRQVTWGDALYLEVKQAGGLKAAHTDLTKLVGNHFGTRNTYAKLYAVESPDQLTETDRLRAWLLISALGGTPQDWNINDTAVPGFMVTRRESVSGTIKAAMRRAGVNGSAHMLRHWFGTALVEAGVDLLTVQTLMRHQNLSTTAIYTAVSDRRQAQGIERIDPFTCAA